MSEPETSSGLPRGAELFLKYNYPETKDLCKQFLTLVAAVLVFSLTFSEKIVRFPDASDTARALILAAWCAMLGAIIACGIGLTLITLAAGDAVYGTHRDARNARYLRLAQRAYVLIVIGGIGFVLGLLLLVATAVVATRSVTRTSVHAAVNAVPVASRPVRGR